VVGAAVPPPVALATLERRNGWLGGARARRLRF
jgi:hypothetical protein